ncbi:MAG: exodeoxyribonuclease VII large subunit [Rikenellaceae bacterium]
MNRTVSSTPLTLSQLQHNIAKSLNESFALPLWVSAEISDIKVNSSGHCYIELIEKGKHDGVAKAQARAVIWRSAYSRIVSYFEAESGTRLERGVKILCKVVVNYHEMYGLSFQITDIDSSYTLGEMERQRQLTIMRLQQEGVWDMNREVKMPMLVQRIAVVSSSNAAGYQDFCKEVGRHPFRIEITLFNSLMQGEAAEESIIEALCEVANREDEFDVLIIIRGGGSVSDLNCFNSYRIASYVAQHPLPIVAGIGHDKDVSVVDLVAHRTLKTPTAVAGWLVERMERIDSWLVNSALSLQEVATELARREELRLQTLQNEILTEAQQLISHKHRDIDQQHNNIRDLSAALLEQQKTKVEHLGMVVNSLSPQNLINLGFAVLQSAERTILSVDDTKVGESINITLRDGGIEAQVTSINRE